MPEGTGVGSVYLDFVVRNTVAQQIRDITSQAAAQAQKGFEAAGKASGDAMQRAFSGGYNKTLEKARVKVRELESQFDSLGSKMDGMRQSAKGMFKGLKDPGRAADQFLGNDKAFNALTAQSARSFFRHRKFCALRQRRPRRKPRRRSSARRKKWRQRQNAPRPGRRRPKPKQPRRRNVRGSVLLPQQSGQKQKRLRPLNAPQRRKNGRRRRPQGRARSSGRKPQRAYAACSKPSAAP